uniref:hypothetical protein n=1 Tax=Clostridium sp. NkU-1 TaxID=1095009 RepID=UPI000AEF53A4
KLANESGNGLLFANVSELKIKQLINLFGNLTHNDNSMQIVFPVSYNEPNRLTAAVNMYYSNATGNILYHFLNNSGLYSGCMATWFLNTQNSDIPTAARCNSLAAD